MIQKALSSQQPRSSSFYYYYYHVVGVFIIITAFQDCSISSSNSKFDPFCVALKASNSQYSHSPTSQSTQPTWKLTMPSSAEAEANNDNDTDDTARFHHYAAAAVELSNAQVVVADDDITSTGTYAMLSRKFVPEAPFSKQIVLFCIVVSYLSFFLCFIVPLFVFLIVCLFVCL